MVDGFILPDIVRVCEDCGRLLIKSRGRYWTSFTYGSRRARGWWCLDRGQFSRCRRLAIERELVRRAKDGRPVLGGQHLNTGGWYEVAQTPRVVAHGIPPYPQGEAPPSSGPG